MEIEIIKGMLFVILIIGFILFGAMIPLLGKMIYDWYKKEFFNKK